MTTINPPLAPSVVITKADGEYRAAYRATIVRDRAARERMAYYTNCPDDALATAARMHDWLVDSDAFNL